MENKIESASICKFCQSPIDYGYDDKEGNFHNQTELNCLDQIKKQIRRQAFQEAKQIIKIGINSNPSRQDYILLNLVVDQLQAKIDEVEHDKQNS